MIAAGQSDNLWHGIAITLSELQFAECKKKGKVVKYEDGMLILGQNDIFCGHNEVNFSVWFFQLTVFKYLVASHVTEPG